MEVDPQELHFTVPSGKRTPHPRHTAILRANLKKSRDFWALPIISDNTSTDALLGTSISTVHPPVSNPRDWQSPFMSDFERSADVISGTSEYPSLFEDEASVDLPYFSISIDANLLPESPRIDDTSATSPRLSPISAAPLVAVSSSVSASFII